MECSAVGVTANDGAETAPDQKNMNQFNRCWVGESMPIRRTIKNLPV